MNYSDAMAFISINPQKEIWPTSIWKNHSAFGAFRANLTEIPLEAMQDTIYKNRNI